MQISKKAKNYIGHIIKGSIALILLLTIIIPIHEQSHVIATENTGGEVSEIKYLPPNAHIMRTGGNDLLIHSAGFIGGSLAIIIIFKLLKFESNWIIATLLVHGSSCAVDFSYIYFSVIFWALLFGLAATIFSGLKYYKYLCNLYDN